VKKRILSMLLVLTMLVGMIPATALTANAAASPTIPNLHRGVFANKEDTNYVYWDAVDGAEHYVVKLYRNGELRRTETTDECYYPWSEMAPRERDDDISWDYYKVDKGDYVVEVNAIDIYGSLETTLASSQVSFSIAKNEQALAISRSKYNYSDNSVGENVNQYVGWQTVRKSVLDWLGYEFAFVEGPDWLDVVVDETGDYVLRGTVPESALDSGSTYTYHTAYVGFSKIGKSDVGFVIEHRFQVRGSATINEMWLTPNFEPEYMSIYDIISTNVQPNITTVYDSTIEGDASSTDSWPFGTRRFIGIWKNDEQVKGTVHTFTTGKYELIWQYLVDYQYNTMELVTYADDVKVYWCNELIGTDPNDSCYVKRMSDKQLHIHKTYYIYDEKPEIKTVLVNGESVADGATYVSNSKSVTVKTTYDSELSQALQDYGCTVKYKTSLNGVDYSNVSPSTSNGNGTSTQTYVQNVNSGSSLTFKSWLEVTWPDGSKDVVDERTVTVMNVGVDFESISPVPTSTELTNKYTDLGTMQLGNAATNIEFKAFPKKLSAAAISDGWTTGRSISVTRDGVEIYNKTYADNELFGWNLKDNIDEGGTYIITLRVFAQKGEQIVEKTHKFRVFVKGSTIKTIALEGVGTPVIGKSPSTINTVKSNTDGVVVKRVIWNYWTSEMGGNWFVMPSGSKFEAGKRYAVEIELQTADGYSFTANKSDMTVYINGEKAGKSVNYDSNKFSAELEFEAITTPEFTTQPMGGEAPYGGKYTVNWATNFTPCKIVVGEYNSLNQVVNQVEYSNTTTSVELPANRYGYVVIAYYNDANAKYSKKITITEAIPAFTTQPVGGEVAKGEKLTVTWVTNFTPKKLQVLKYNQGYCTGTQTLDVNATTANVSAGDEYCTIRAYYSDSNYVVSDKFYVTEKVSGSGVTVSGTVTSFNSNTDEITVALYKEGSASADYTVTVKGNSASYTLSGVAAGTYTMKVSKNNHVTREYALTVGTGNVTQDVKIHLKGDINGDGRVNTTDVGRANAHAKKTNLLSGYELSCADVSGDGKVNTTDVGRMNAHAKKTNLMW